MTTKDKSFSFNDNCCLYVEDHQVSPKNDIMTISLSIAPLNGRILKWIFEDIDECEEFLDALKSKISEIKKYNRNVYKHNKNNNKGDNTYDY